MKYKCRECGYIYDENAGDLNHGVKNDTKFIDVTEDWVCPNCGVSKNTFQKLEE